VTKLYERAPANFQERLDYFSQQFIGAAYGNNPLGEDEHDFIDQDPIFSLTRFDCVTYVETAMALALAENENEFLKQLTRLRYLDGKVSFVTRHHFMEYSWIPALQKQGLLKDVTSIFFPTEIARKENVVNLKSWYLGLNVLELGVSQKSTEIRKGKIREIAKTQTSQTMSISYVPTQSALHKIDLFGKIPSGSLVFFVVDAPGKSLISHVGILKNKGGVSYIRHASSRANKRKVAEERLTAFLKGQIQLPGLIGLHIESIELHK
jgi:hypothetical protein